MTKHDEALWDPQVEPDADLQRLQGLLTPYGVSARGIGEWTPRQQWTPRLVDPLPRSRRIVRALAAGLAACAMLYAGHVYRLAWSDGQPWPVTGQASKDLPASVEVSPGEVLATNAQESLTITVARIGSIALSPGSRLRLVETRAGKHRVDLEHGHLRARIWAPPGYFGVIDGASEVIDLGCDFDLWKQGDGSGRVYVRSGWVAYRVGPHEALVPAGYAMHFNAHRLSTPTRPEADAAFVAAVQALERTLVEPEFATFATRSASDAVASAARDADAFTLLSLLSQHPTLAEGALYPRLGSALKVKSDATHRAAWAAGDTHAIDAWWGRLPTQPKQWWRHWSDVFG